MTKKPKLELFPIKKVEVWSFGKVQDFYWVVQTPDGTEIQCKTYEDAVDTQQANK